MKTKSKLNLLVGTFLISFSAFAEIYTSQLPAIEIQSSEQSSAYGYSQYEASQTALPAEIQAKLLSKIKQFNFTVIPEDKLTEIFNSYTTDPLARMEDAAGLCATRRMYIQKDLKKQNIISGQFYISCNRGSGRLKLLDRAINRHRTYLNYHDVNLFAVETASGEIDFRVVDVQFEDEPVSISEYLGEVEVSQPMKPKKGGLLAKLETKNCFWEVNSERMSFENALK